MTSIGHFRGNFPGVFLVHSLCIRWIFDKKNIRKTIKIFLCRYWIFAGISHIVSRINISVAGEEIKKTTSSQNNMILYCIIGEKRQISICRMWFMANLTISRSKLKLRELRRKKVSRARCVRELCLSNSIRKRKFNFNSSSSPPKYVHITAKFNVRIYRRILIMNTYNRIERKWKTARSAFARKSRVYLGIYLIFSTRLIYTDVFTAYFSYCYSIVSYWYLSFS